MAKATTTLKQVLNYKPQHAAWFASTQQLFNRVVAFYFEVITAHEGVLDLSSQEALTTLETLTHATQANPTPLIPLAERVAHVPAMFRRAAIHAALGSARSFSTHLAKWRAKKEKAPAILQARHADGNEHGTAHKTGAGMAASVSDIPHPLRFPCES